MYDKTDVTVIKVDMHLQAVRERKDVLHGSTTRYQSIKRLGLVEVMVITEYKYKYFVPLE